MGEGLAHHHRRLHRRLIGAVVITVAIVTLVLAVPPLRTVARAISHMSPGWIVLAVAAAWVRGRSLSSACCS